jgi:hypothetical protein
MREITFDHHGEHAWLHFSIRLGIILLLIFLLLVLTENSLGQAVKQQLSLRQSFDEHLSGQSRLHPNSDVCC